MAIAADGGTEVHIGTNTYPWTTFARREGRELTLHTDEFLGDIASTGIQGYEPIIQSPSDFAGLAERLTSHGLAMRSIYVNSVLHDPAQSDESIQEVLSIAEQAAKLGTRILVTNPSPIRWGGTDDKTDDQLKHQAESLDRLGEKLRRVGVTLAYHNHDSELRQGAREFHHMLASTNSEHVKFCLDSHWIYRGCGNSQVALFDVVSHYQDRVVEMHLRQSQDGIWTETFSLEGDIDYRRLIQQLASRGIRPHMVLEQAIEEDTDLRLGVVAAHARSFQTLSESGLL
jgi:inosose dehydratase